MKTKYINLKEEYNEEKIKEAAQDILNGELVIFPTETVYGIGANALNDNACKNIFKAKGRAGDNPLIVHVNNVDMIKQLVEEPNEIEKILINTFCPGPFTLILKAKNIIPKSVTAGLETVGIRMPSNKIANKLIEYAGVPIAAPSANVSGRPSGTKIEDILKEFDGKVSTIIDDGMVDIGLESTVVRVIDNKVRILRPGKITRENIEKLGMEVEIDKNNSDNCGSFYSVLPDRNDKRTAGFPRDEVSDLLTEIKWNQKGKKDYILKRSTQPDVWRRE